jgi:uncharacterized delta-60 repeat protein
LFQAKSEGNRMRNRVVLIAASMVVLCTQALPALASCFVPSTPNDGYFDQTWGGAGLGCVVFDGDNSDSQAGSNVKKIIPTSGGSLVLGGAASGNHGISYWWVGKLDASGAFDPAFGDVDNSGRITECTLGAACGSQGFNDFDLQQDGKVAVLDSSTIRRTTVDAHAFDAAGVVGGTGTIYGSFLIGTPSATLYAALSDSFGGIATAPGGKTFAIGFGWGPVNADFGIGRLNTDLSLDTSFHAVSSGGITWAGGNLIEFGTSAEASQIFQQNDGTIVLAGSNGYKDILIARVTANGVLDTTFNSTGFQIYGPVPPATLPPGPIVDEAAPTRPAVVDRAGRVVIVFDGYDGSYYGPLVTRFKADGTPDTSWNASYAAGWAFYSHGTSPALSCMNFQPTLVRPLAIDSAGRILIYGMCDSEFGVVRLRGDTGALDTSWGVNGVSHGDFDTSGHNDEADSVVFDSAGHLYISGGVEIGASTQQQAVVARLTYDLIYTNNLEDKPSGCEPPNCN